MKPNEVDRLYELAVWYEGLRATNNETFMPLFADTHRYLVLKGGGGSGKSIFAGRKILERAISEPGHRFLVCRKVARTIRESCFKQLLGQLAEQYPRSGYKANKSDLAITFPNGSEIIFAGLDDVEKLKSIYNITGVWIEEASELLEGDFNQLDIRLRGETRYYKQIIISFNPISVTHWLKKRFFDRHDPRALVHESTYRDNRFLDAAAVRTLEAFKETDEYYYQVYCLGMWGVTGKSVFDAKAIARRLESLPKPIKVGYFAYDYDGMKITNIRWVNDRSGYIRLYAMPNVPEFTEYCIGGDTAGDGSDYFTGHVLDARTGMQVAVLRHQFDADQYAKQMYCLGKFYKDALIGIEANFDSYPIMELSRLGYPKQYTREAQDTYTGRLEKRFGFKTTVLTRPTIISALIEVVREHCDTINDRVTLEELTTIVRSEKGRVEAPEGGHDDMMMGLAIAHHVRSQVVFPSDVVHVSPQYRFGAERDQEPRSDYGDEIVPI